MVTNPIMRQGPQYDDVNSADRIRAEGFKGSIRTTAQAVVLQDLETLPLIANSCSPHAANVAS